jgi:glycosyltransferase involved in cell wall biosynthesis
MLSVVIPARNERESLRPTVAALVAALDGAAIRHEIIVVDDGRLAKVIKSDFSGLRAVYVGSFTPERGLFEMVQALEIANAAVSVRLWLIGLGSTADIRAAAKLPGWQYVDYVPPQPQEQAFAYVSRADVGLVVFRDVGDHATIDTNKLYEYMAFGLTIHRVELREMAGTALGCNGWRIRQAR